MKELENRKVTCHMSSLPRLIKLKNTGPVLFIHFISDVYLFADIIHDRYHCAAEFMG